MKKIKDLKKEIFKIAEQAYRRGYQQGNFFAGFGVDQKQCYTYRYFRAIDKPWGCPEKYSDGKIHIKMGPYKSLEDIHLTADLRRMLHEIELELLAAYEGEYDIID